MLNVHNALEIITMKLSTSFNMSRNATYFTGISNLRKFEQKTNSLFMVEVVPDDDDYCQRLRRFPLPPLQRRRAIDIPISLDPRKIRQLMRECAVELLEKTATKSNNILKRRAVLHENISSCIKRKCFEATNPPDEPGLITQGITRELNLNDPHRCHSSSTMDKTPINTTEIDSTLLIEQLKDNSPINTTETPELLAEAIGTNPNTPCPSVTVTINMSSQSKIGNPAKKRRTRSPENLTSSPSVELNVPKDINLSPQLTTSTRICSSKGKRESRVNSISNDNDIEDIIKNSTPIFEINKEAICVDNQLSKVLEEKKDRVKAKEKLIAKKSLFKATTNHGNINRLKKNMYTERKRHNLSMMDLDGVSDDTSPIKSPPTRKSSIPFLDNSIISDDRDSDLIDSREERELARVKSKRRESNTKRRQSVNSEIEIRNFLCKDSVTTNKKDLSADHGKDETNKSGSRRTSRGTVIPLPDMDELLNDGKNRKHKKNHTSSAKRHEHKGNSAKSDRIENSKKLKDTEMASMPSLDAVPVQQANKRSPTNITKHRDTVIMREDSFNNGDEPVTTIIQAEKTDGSSLVADKQAAVTVKHSENYLTEDSSDITIISKAHSTEIMLEDSASEDIEQSDTPKNLKTPRDSCRNNKVAAQPIVKQTTDVILPVTGSSQNGINSQLLEKSAKAIQEQATSTIDKDNDTNENNSDNISIRVLEIPDGLGNIDPLLKQIEQWKQYASKALQHFKDKSQSPHSTLDGTNQQQQSTTEPQLIEQPISETIVPQAVTPQLNIAAETRVESPESTSSPRIRVRPTSELGSRWNCATPAPVEPPSSSIQSTSIAIQPQINYPDSLPVGSSCGTTTLPSLGRLPTTSINIPLLVQYPIVQQQVQQVTTTMATNYTGNNTAPAINQTYQTNINNSPSPVQRLQPSAITEQSALPLVQYPIPPPQVQPMNTTMATNSTGNVCVPTINQACPPNMNINNSRSGLQLLPTPVVERLTIGIIHQLIDLFRQLRENNLLLEQLNQRSDGSQRSLLNDRYLNRGKLEFSIMEQLNNLASLHLQYDRSCIARLVSHLSDRYNFILQPITEAEVTRVFQRNDKRRHHEARKMGTGRSPVPNVTMQRSPMENSINRNEMPQQFNRPMNPPKNSSTITQLSSLVDGIPLNMPARIPQPVPPPAAYVSAMQEMRRARYYDGGLGPSASPMSTPPNHLHTPPLSTEQMWMLANQILKYQKICKWFDDAAAEAKANHERSLAQQAKKKPRKISPRVRKSTTANRDPRLKGKNINTQQQHLVSPVVNQPTTVELSGCIQQANNQQQPSVCPVVNQPTIVELRGRIQQTNNQQQPSVCPIVNQPTILEQTRPIPQANNQQQHSVCPNVNQPTIVKQTGQIEQANNELPLPLNNPISVRNMSIAEVIKQFYNAPIETIPKKSLIKINENNINGQTNSLPQDAPPYDLTLTIAQNAILPEHNATSSILNFKETDVNKINDKVNVDTINSVEHATNQSPAVDSANTQTNIVGDSQPEQIGDENAIQDTRESVAISEIPRKKILIPKRETHDDADDIEVIELTDESTELDVQQHNNLITPKQEKLSVDESNKITVTSTDNPPASVATTLIPKQEVFDVVELDDESFNENPSVNNDKVQLNNLIIPKQETFDADEIVKIVTSAHEFLQFMETDDFIKIEPDSTEDSTTPAIDTSRGPINNTCNGPEEKQEDPDVITLDSSDDDSDRATVILEDEITSETVKYTQSSIDEELASIALVEKLGIKDLSSDDYGMRVHNGTPIVTRVMTIDERVFDKLANDDSQGLSGMSDIVDVTETKQQNISETNPRMIINGDANESNDQICSNCQIRESNNVGCDCGEASYCSVACFEAHWPVWHANICKNLKSETNLITKIKKENG